VFRKQDINIIDDMSLLFKENSLVLNSAEECNYSMTKPILATQNNSATLSFIELAAHLSLTELMLDWWKKK
jgi:hypothetical protein